MLYELEYFCQLCGRWLDVGSAPFDSFDAASDVVRKYSTASRPLRIVDDFGNRFDAWGNPWR